MGKTYDLSFLEEGKINEILRTSEEKAKDKEEVRRIIEKAKKQKV